MRKTGKQLLVAATVGMMLLAGPVLAADMLPPSVAGTSGSAQLVGVVDNAPGYSPGAWEAIIPAGSNYVQYYPVWESLPAGTTVGDIKSISYYTKKDAAANTVDWFLSIYTFKENDGKDASWYRSLLNTEPIYSANRNAPANQWNQWNSASGANQMRFFDYNRNGAQGGGPTLADLAGGVIDWQNNYPSLYQAGFETWDYSTEEIRGISLKAGDTGAGWAYEGMLDGLRIELLDGTVVEHNMVPEPATMSLLAMGGLALIRRRRRNRK